MVLPLREAGGGEEIMRPTKTERLKKEAEIAALQKSREEQEAFLAWAVEKFDLDFSPPYLPQEKKIMLDYYPRRWSTLLRLFPSWESLPEMQRLNCVFVVKFGLNPAEFPLRQIEKNRPDMAIQAAISKVLGKEHGHGSSESFDPALFKFKK